MVVACSGGADSVALFRGLVELRAKRGFGLGLKLVHVDHGLRGDSAAHAAWAMRLAQNFDVEAETVCLGPLPAGNLEAAAREARYAALAHSAVQTGASAVLTAHTADDQLETMLMRLLRGTGVRGAAGMPGKRALDPGDGKEVSLLRPLLGVSRATLRAFLAERGQGFQHDTTNDDTTRLRARLRRDVLPTLRELSREVGSNAAALAEDLREIDSALRWAAESVRFPLERSRARGVPAAVLDAALGRELEAAAVPADRRNREARVAMVRACRDSSGRSRCFDLGPRSLCVDAVWIRLKPA